MVRQRIAVLSLFTWLPLLLLAALEGRAVAGAVVPFLLDVGILLWRTETAAASRSYNPQPFEDHKTMSTRSLFRTALLLALIPTATAQDGATPQAPPTRATQGAALVIKTAETELASGMAGEVEVPALPEGHHYVLTIDGPGKTTVTTAAGKIGFLEMTAKPGRLMELYAEEVAQVERMAQGGAMMGMGQAGIEPKDAAKVVKAMFDFPKQIDTLDLKVSGHPEHAKRDGMDVDVHLAPVAGSGFAGFLATAKPAGEGVPQLAGEAMLRMAGSLDSKALTSALAPLMEWAFGMLGKSAEETKALAQFTDKMMACTSGTFSVTMGSDGMRMAMGLSDPELYRKLLASPEYKEFSKVGQAMASMEIELTEKALEHRSIPVMKQVTKAKDGAEMPPNPLFGDGPMETLVAVAGSYVVATMGANGEGKIKALIDQAIDSKFETAPLADGALITMDIQLAKFIEQMGGPGGDDMPDRLRLLLGKTANGLSLKFRAK
jgi:hypothetical protein